MYNRKFALLFICFIIQILLTIKGASSANQHLKKSISKTDFILVITLDGYLYAIGKYSGEIKWSFQEQSLISNNPSKTFNDNGCFFIDPRFGYLYIHSDKRDEIKTFPYTIAELVNTSPSKTVDGLLFAGDKSDEWVAIDYENGLNLGTLTSETYASRISDSDEKILYIGRTKYTVTIFDMNSRTKIFNISYFDYSDDSIFKENNDENMNYYQFYHFTSSSDGSIVTLDKNNGDFVWHLNLDSPVISIYRFHNEIFQKVDFNIFGSEELKNYDILYQNILNKNKDNVKIIEKNTNDESIIEKFYIGLHKNSLYALPTRVFDSKIEYGSDDLDDSDISHAILGHHSLPEKMVLPNNYIQSNSKLILISENNDDLNAFIDSLNEDDFLCRHKNLNHFDYLNTVNMLNYIFQYSSFIDESIHFYFLIFSSFFLIVILLLVSKSLKKLHNKVFHISLKKNSRSSKDSFGNKIKESNTNHSVEIITQNSNKVKTVEIGKIKYDPTEIIGNGCCGTIIYKGKYEKRPVAIKRLLSECFTLAEKEVDLLRYADHHENVIRYFCTESDSQFKYIAIELCQMTLHDYVQNKNDLICEGKYSLSTLNILEQATKGLNHLHMLGIVHRDLKPQNILLTYPDQRGKVFAQISDFGLCKRLKSGNNSFTKKSSMIGTEGWTARELLSSNYRELHEDSVEEKLKKVTKSVDIFSLGCVFYYALSGGYHPFGEQFLRQANIINNEFKLEKLVYSWNYEIYTQQLLIEEMISIKPDQRPTTSQILAHPIFWSKAKILQFLLDVCDRFENVYHDDILLKNLEKNSHIVIKNNWKTHICPYLQADLKKFRTYNGVFVNDLLRAIRNKKHHYRDSPEEVMMVFGSMPDGFVDYFITRFPKLLLHVYNTMKPCQNEPTLNVYYHTKEDLV